MNTPIMHFFERQIIFLIAFIFLILLSCYESSADQYKVTRVADGDTITVVNNGQKSRIRRVGIDAPEKSRRKHEPGQPFSQKSSKYLVSLVLNKHVNIVFYGKDRYRRILGVVYVDDNNVNLEMVKAGLAEVYRGRPAKGFDNKPYQEAEARSAKRGMWSLGDKYISPWEWRRMNQ